MTSVIYTLFKINFYWIIVDLRCVSFRCIAKRISYTYKNHLILKREFDKTSTKRFGWYFYQGSPNEVLRYWIIFPHSSVGKESACNAGDPGSIPGLGRSAGEGIGYPLQYSWASIVAQLVKNPPAMWETWVRSFDWEDPLEKGKAARSSILAWGIPWTI